VLILRQSTRPSALFLRAKGAPFELMSSPGGLPLVRNTFQVLIRHQGSKEYALLVRVADSNLRDLIQLTQPIRPWRLQEAEVKQVLIVRFTPEFLRTLDGEGVLLEFVDQGSGEVVARRELKLVGPL